MRHGRALTAAGIAMAAALALLLTPGLSWTSSHTTTKPAADIELTIVNIQTPQGVKVWVPESFFAMKGDMVKLTLVNKLDAEHGYKIEAFGIEEVVAAESTNEVSFKADKAGIFPITCHLHPPHVSGQLVVLE